MAARTQRLIALALAGFLAWIAMPVGARQSADAPQRIVSLVPALTEILFAIGAGAQVVGVSSYDDDPPAVRALPRVGALLDPNTERILSLRPDLVLVYGSQAALKAQLGKAGIDVFEYRHAGLADVLPVFRTLGSITGHEAEAEQRVTEIETALAAVRTRVAGRHRPRTLLVMGREPRSLRGIDASGGIGFLHDVLELAGGRNVFEDVQTQAVRTSTELLIARAPDVVVELHYGFELDRIQRTEALALWQRLGSIPAVKSGRIHLLFGDHLVVPGPRLVRAAEEFARAIHPEAFP